MSTKIAPYGTWESPISPDDFAASSSILSQVDVNKKNGKIYLLEVRPHENGRSVIIEYADGKERDVLPNQYSAASQVHEYGGASFAIRETDGHVVFTDKATKTVFDLDPQNGDTVPITDADDKFYYADFSCHPTDGKWTLAIQEDHHAGSIEAVENTIVAIDASNKSIHTLVKGTDFATFPRFCPRDNYICWIQWNFPSMPWNHTELWMAEFVDGEIRGAFPVAGHDIKASVTQPVWSLDGKSLYFVDDRTGFWQLYEYRAGSVRHINLKGLEEAEFGVPDFFLGGRTYAPLTDTKLFAFYSKEVRKTAIEIDLTDDSWKHVDCPITDFFFSNLSVLNPTKVACIGSTLTKPKAFYLVDIENASNTKLLRSSNLVDVPESYASTPKHITFPRKHGPGGGHAYALYFPPTNPNFKAPEGSLPPLIVAMHGGPTYANHATFDMRDAFLWTRGYALVQVNYVGSTGYGKHYASLLNHHWGISDVADAASCVEYLAQQGLIDKTRVAITGHSAGGYAAMQAPCVYPSIWACSVAESGISDASAMLGETHKFESRYLEPLFFPADASDQDKQRIINERSPVHNAHKITAPMLIMGGLDDPVCPPNQNTMLYERIKEEGVEVELQLYEGEGHMFVRGETLRDMESRREKWFRKYLVDRKA